MNFLQINDLKKGLIQISWQRGNDIPRQYQNPVAFTDPLNREDRKELRWYLEDYVIFPYGAERYRAERLENRMAELGESLFNQVFIKGEHDPDPRSFYQEAVREGLDRCELCITSDDPVFLSIPWELIRDPTPGRGYLATSLGGLYRQRTGQKIEIHPESADKLFRILLVIARPYGKCDVPMGTVARPVLEALRPFRDRIHLEVLRPPTFDAFQKKLSEHPYDLVHFDGHGVFVPPSDKRYSQFLAGNGHLVFEKNDGSENIVNSQDLGQALSTSGVPLFVLNACQSARRR